MTLVATSRRSSVASRPALSGEIAVVVVLVSVYDRIRDIAATRTDLAFVDAARVLRIESWLHLDVEHRINHWLAAHWHVEWAASVYYQLMHLSVTLGVLGWLYVARPDRYRSARTALVYVSGLGLVVFWLMPVAPPRLLAGFVDSGAVTGVADHTAHVSPDLYAAMPSLHVAWATWVLLQVWPAVRSALVRRLVAAHGAVTVAVVVSTANHFLLDVAAGAATTLLATWLARGALGGNGSLPSQAGRTGRRRRLLPATPSPAAGPPAMPAVPNRVQEGRPLPSLAVRTTEGCSGPAGRTH